MLEGLASAMPGISPSEATPLAPREEAAVVRVERDYI
jgi:hypothetical protein